MEETAPLDSFTGELTDEVRRRIQIKRKSLGLTYSRLGLFLYLDWSTIRKWETGPTRFCSPPQREKLRRFLSGCYDRELSLAAANSFQLTSPGVPTAVRKSLVRIANTYQICRENDKLKDRLVKELDGVVCTTLRRLTEAPDANFSSYQSEEYF